MVAWKNISLRSSPSEQSWQVTRAGQKKKQGMAEVNWEALSVSRASRTQCRRHFPDVTRFAGFSWERACISVFPDLELPAGPWWSISGLGLFKLVICPQHLPPSRTAIETQGKNQVLFSFHPSSQPWLLDPEVLFSSQESGTTLPFRP